MNMKFLVAATLLSAAAFSAHANQLRVGEEDFQQQRARIERDLADGKTYAEIDRLQRIEVRDALDRMSGLVGRADSVDQLSPQEKAALFNDQERVNTILTGAAADSRVVCDHSTKVGTRMKSTRCETVAERRRRMDADRDVLQNKQRALMPVRN